MLAYEPGVAVAYDIGLTAFPWSPPMASPACGLAVAVLSRRAGRRRARRRHRRRRRRLHALPRHVGARSAGPRHLGARSRRRLDRSRHAARRRRRSPSRCAGKHARHGRRRPVLTLAIVAHHFTAMGAVEIMPDPTRVIDTSRSRRPRSRSRSPASPSRCWHEPASARFADRRMQERESAASTRRSTTCPRAC